MLYYCECDSVCTLRADVSDQDFKECPFLFADPKVQFIVNFCHKGPEIGATPLYETRTFRVYMEQE